MKNTNGTDPKGPSRFQPAPILLLSSIMFAVMLGRVVFSPLLLRIEADLGVSHTEAATFFLLISIGYSIAMLLSGYLSHWLTHRITIIVSTAMGGLALFFVAFSSSLWTIRLALFLLGACSGLYLPSGMASLYSLVDSRHWGKALGIHELGPAMSFMAAPLIAQVFAPLLSWRGTLMLIAGCSLLLAAVYTLFGSGGRFRGEVPNLKNVRLLLAQPSTAIMLLYFVLVAGAAIGAFSFLPAYLATERNMSERTVNVLLSASRFSGPAMVFVAGWMADKLNVKRLFVTLFICIGFLTALLGLLRGLPLILVLFIQPLFNNAFFPTAFALMARVMPPNLRNLAVSLVVPMAYLIGGGVVPVLMGYLGEHGRFWVGFVILGSMIVLSLVLLPGLKSAKRNAAGADQASRPGESV